MFMWSVGPLIMRALGAFIWRVVDMARAQKSFFKSTWVDLDRLRHQHGTGSSSSRVPSAFLVCAHVETWRRATA